MYTPGKSLNMGIERCDNEVTLVISAHCEIVSWTNWIPKTLKSLGAIWGKQIPIWDGKRVTPRYLWSNFGEEVVTNHWCESENRYFFHNAFSVFNTEHIKKYKFDERLSGKEDRYWATEQIDMGYDIVYNPEYVVKHHYTHNGATWKGVG